MSSKFVKKLKRDLKKSPGKAAVLALLSGVAIWFWAPLVMNLFRSEAKPVAAASATPSFPAAMPTSIPTQPSQPPMTSWKQIADAIDHDPRMKPAARLVLPRDPFLLVEPVKPKDTAAVAKPAAPPAPLDVPPAEAGLVLSGTIVGTQRSIARLNGKNYSAGDFVKASASDISLSYRVVDVTGRSVILALGDKQYQLNMPRRQPGASANAGTDSSEMISSDSPDFDPSILEQLN